MRRNRVIWYIAFILSLLGISFYGGVISYSLFYFVLIIPVISLFYIFLVYSRFRFYQKTDTREPVANTVTPFYLTLRNDEFFSFSGIRLVFFYSFSRIDGFIDDTEYELTQHSGITERTNLICRYRGEYEVGIKKIIVQDFFRLFSITYNNKEPLRVIAKINVVPIAEIKTIDISPRAVKSSDFNPTEKDVLVREYEPGDDRRMINWKATARLGRPMTFKLTGETRQSVGILFDTQRFTDDIFEYLPVENRILEIVCSLNLCLLGSNIGVNTMWYDGGYRSVPATRVSDFDELYSQLNRLIFEKNIPDTLPGAGLTDCNVLFLVISRWTDKYRNLAAFLESSGVTTVVYLVENVVDSKDEANIPAYKNILVRRVTLTDDLREVI